MLLLKRSIKCNGDLSQDYDQYGPCIACVQCGHHLSKAEKLLLGYGERPSRDQSVRLTSNEIRPRSTGEKAMVGGVWECAFDSRSYERLASPSVGLAS